MLSYCYISIKKIEILLKMNNVLKNLNGNTCLYIFIFYMNMNMYIYILS